MEHSLTVWRICRDGSALVDWKFIINKYWKKVRWRKTSPPPEPDVWKLLSKIRGRVFVDVGANGGQVYTIPLHSHFDHVYAVEPNHRLANVISERVRKKNIHNITVCEFAAWNQSGEDVLWIDGSQSSGSSTLLPQRADQRSLDGGRVLVKTCSLDDYFNIGEVSLLKIDAEGAEFMVLDGAKQLLKKTQNILIECHHQPYIVDPSVSKRLDSILRDIGFNTSWIDATHIFGFR